MKDVILKASESGLYDLFIQNGDLVVADSDKQHISLIVLSEKGWWKNAPFLGANVRDAVSDEGSLLEVQGNIQEAIEDDGATIISLKIDRFITVEAKWNLNK